MRRLFLFNPGIQCTESRSVPLNTDVFDFEHYRDLGDSRFCFVPPCFAEALRRQGIQIDPGNVASGFHELAALMEAQTRCVGSKS